MPIFNLSFKKKIPELEEYRQFSKLRIISIFIIGFITIVFCLGIYFVYYNIFGAIEQVQSLIIMKPNLSMEVIDFEKIEKVKNNWDIKHNSEITPLLRDPFSSTSTIFLEKEKTTTPPILKTTTNPTSL